MGKSRQVYDKIASRYLPEGYDLQKLRRMQSLLASRVIERDFIDPESVDKVCGLDLAYIRQGDEEYGIACAVVYSIKQGKIVEQRCSVVKVTFPYIPTLLSLRELRPMIVTFLKLTTCPEVVLIDGHGRAHPYRLGIASHFGVVMRMPTIGVAKSLLYGELKCQEGVEDCDIVDEETGEIIGKAVRHGSKYVYVSVGNMITLDTAVKIVKKLLRTSSQMPLPILYAHRLCNEFKQKYVKNVKSGNILDFL